MKDLGIRNYRWLGCWPSILLCCHKHTLTQKKGARELQWALSDAAGAQSMVAADSAPAFSGQVFGA